jgi:hypothetical protein
VPVIARFALNLADGGVFPPPHFGR